MKKEQIKDGIKAGTFYGTNITAGVFLGLVGGAFLNSLKINCILKGVAYIGWLAISNKISYDVASHAENVTEEFIDLVEDIANERNGKGISA